MPSHEGKFVWYELMTTDMAAAAAYYRSVVGWGARDSGVPGVDYTLFLAGEAMVAGLMDIPQEAKAAGARPGWIGYVAVADVDASAERVRSAGGAVHHAPSDIPGVGRFAVVADPQGAVFALFRGAGEPPPAPAPGTAGHVGWHELYAAEREAAFAFYAGQFGWVKSDAMDMGPMGVYQLIARSGEAEAFGGIMTKPDTVPAPFWNFYFAVEAIDAAGARVAEGGGKTLNGPMQVPGGSWIIQCLDPQGAFFSLVAPRR
jgi:predicted enzyme related to lactoylglutathione lyase